MSWQSLATAVWLRIAITWLFPSWLICTIQIKLILIKEAETELDIGLQYKLSSVMLCTHSDELLTYSPLKGVHDLIATGVNWYFLEI